MGYRESSSRIHKEVPRVVRGQTVLPGAQKEREGLVMAAARLC